MQLDFILELSTGQPAIIRINYRTRCRPSKGRRCIPDVDIWVHVETYLNDFSSSAQVKIQVEFNFELF